MYQVDEAYQADFYKRVTADPADVLERKETPPIYHQLHTAVDQLPPKQQAVLGFCILCDVPETKAAELLATTPKNVQRLCRKALSTLRLKLLLAGPH